MKKIRQRVHTSTGDRDALKGTYQLDTYPEIDSYIPIAEELANLAFPDRAAPGYRKDWDSTFHHTMDTLLKKDGLRV